MNEGDVLLAALPQADGSSKKRPVLLLRKMPGYGDLLVCGISTKLHQFISAFDEMLSEAQEDFRSSGLKTASVVRLGFLYVLPSKRVQGKLGALSPACHARLRRRLADYLLKS